MEKIKINAYIPRELDEALRLRIAKEYPLEIRGKYSLSIEAALIASLRRSGLSSRKEFESELERLRKEGLNENDIKRVCVAAYEVYALYKN